MLLMMIAPSSVPVLALVFLSSSLITLILRDACNTARILSSFAFLGTERGRHNRLQRKCRTCLNVRRGRVVVVVRIVMRVMIVWVIWRRRWRRSIVSTVVGTGRDYSAIASIMLHIVCLGLTSWRNLCNIRCTHFVEFNPWSEKIYGVRAEKVGVHFPVSIDVENGCTKSS